MPTCQVRHYICRPESRLNFIAAVALFPITVRNRPKPFYLQMPPTVRYASVILRCARTRALLQPCHFRHHFLNASNAERRLTQPRGYTRHFHTSPVAFKVISFNLPDIGEGIAEVEVLKWFVSPGDTVAQFDKLLEVQSDKATVDITSRYDGVITKLHHKVGELAPTGKPLLDIELAGSSADDTHSAASTDSKSQGAEVPPKDSHTDELSSSSSTSLRALATPAVRRIAKEHGLPSLAQITGTGKDGRVTKDDVQRFLAAGGATMVPPVGTPKPQQQQSSSLSSNLPTTSTSPPAVVSPGPAAAAAAPLPHPSRAPASFTLPPDVVLPVRGLQRAMVKTMTNAWAAPHFGFSDEVIVDELMRARAALTPAAKARGLKLTYMPFMIKAASLALASHPQVRRAHRRSENTREEVPWLLHANARITLPLPCSSTPPWVRAHRR
jgi:2-oxoisovalerate dehydrogenase E2 component (dihydrolipoyl transacylase)